MHQIPLGISAYKKPDGLTGSSYKQSVVNMPADAFDVDEYIALLVRRSGEVGSFFSADLGQRYVRQQLDWAEAVYRARFVVDMSVSISLEFPF